jgi:hypothetical protein
MVRGGCNLHFRFKSEEASATFKLFNKLGSTERFNRSSESETVVWGRT